MFALILFVMLSSIWGNSCDEHKHTYRTDLSSSDFSSIVKTIHFVDKTMLIKEFFQSEKFVLITAPRRFGKSTNMDMIQRFSELVVDEKGNKKERNSTSNYETFVDNELQIVKDWVFFNKHFGNYPVIILDFKNLACGNYKSFINSFRELVMRAYVYHKYLMFSDKFNEYDKKDFFKYYDDDNIDRLNGHKLMCGIRELTRLLYKHFNTRLVILIDEFDGPIQEVINYEGSGTQLILKFIMGFISSTLKNNFNVNRVLINACVLLSGFLTTDINNFVRKPFLSDSRFSKFYGFTEMEVKVLLTNRNISTKIDEVKSWFDGYRVRGDNYTIYNTFAISNYLQSNTLKSYWADSGGIKDAYILFAHHRILHKIEMLLEDFKNKKEGVKIKYRKKFRVEDIEKLIQLNIQHKIYVNQIDLYLQYLTDQGYFNIIKTEDPSYAYICIPNKEIEIKIELIITSCYFYKHKLKKKKNLF